MKKIIPKEKISIIDLVNDISNMPTEYFEAKPRRAVGLDEIKAVLIPSNASKELKTALLTITRSNMKQETPKTE